MLLRLLLLLVATVFSSCRPLIPGVLTWEAGSCAIDWHAWRPAVVIACPGRAMTRVYPLPIVSPWSDEDPVTPAPPELPPPPPGHFSSMEF